MFVTPFFSKFEYLQTQLTETVSVQNNDDIDNTSREREKYWQVQLCMLSLGLNNLNEWCALTEKVIRNDIFIDILDILFSLI